MRRYQKRQIEDFIHLLDEAHASIRKALRSGERDSVLQLLAQCQEGAVGVGTLIESTEGEGTPTVALLEDYCEQVYQCCEAVRREDPAMSGNRICKVLSKSISGVKASVERDLRVRTEIVFFPYQVSMWDSLESVWRAADADPDCDAYVVPIPYYDRNPDGSLGKFHYEGGMYPPDVPVVDWRTYDLENRRPDVAYIHNPYDDCNFVTSVDPAYYSAELKRYVDLLVYIPYYSTSGGMAESQRSCPAYYNADYIVIQAERYRSFFDAALPPEKLVPLGSPKFDRVIRMCAAPPEPPEAWREKIAGRRVYFYNTSIGGLLSDAEKFLKKIEYVFRCFEGRKDSCLLWRPHPLLESTFDSMRPQFRPFYEELKTRFAERGLGIYDDTPDITKSIALSDAYIGDSGTSVISLFGMAGKPVFVLGQDISALPDEEDWRGGTIWPVPYEQQMWLLANGNQIYYAPERDFHYHFCCNCSGYAGKGMYSKVVNLQERHFVCPASAQEILEINEHGVQKRIALLPLIQRSGAFTGAEQWGKYIVLIPNYYPAIVRYDTEAEEVSYFTGHLDVFSSTVNGGRRIGGFCVQGEYLYLASPVDNRILAFHIPTGREDVYSMGDREAAGCFRLISDGEELWKLPWTIDGMAVRWNPKTGEERTYPLPRLRCVSPYHGWESDEKPFSYAVFWGRYVYLSPFEAEDFLRLDRETGEAAVWKPPFDLPRHPKSGYFTAWSRGYFLNFAEGSRRRFFSSLDLKLYDIDMAEDTCKEIPLDFSLTEVRMHQRGFVEQSPWLQYACVESAFNTLPNFLEGHVAGDPFDRAREMEAYGSIASNSDGTCGEKTHALMMEKLRRRKEGSL